tara:strand:+ start:89 stop:469 length:381 start_codon:yes stop_codon:yes gene_type:complete
MNVINKLTQWGSLIGVICAIGGGFYAWGEFNTRLANIESRPVADMTSITEDVANLKVNMVDRITAIEDKLEAQSESDLGAIQSDISEMKDSLTKALKDIEIQTKVNELQDQKIEQVRLKATNPLAN